MTNVLIIWAIEAEKIKKKEYPKNYLYSGSLYINESVKTYYNECEMEEIKFPENVELSFCAIEHSYGAFV